MEDGLVRIYARLYNHFFKWVLILVVVEDGLVQAIAEGKEFAVSVLILVVVEDGLVHVEQTERVAGEQYEGLNPCCSGRWSRTCEC